MAQDNDNTWTRCFVLEVTKRSQGLCGIVTCVRSDTVRHLLPTTMVHGPDGTDYHGSVGADGTNYLVVAPAHAHL